MPKVDSLDFPTEERVRRCGLVVEWLCRLIGGLQTLELQPQFACVGRKVAEKLDFGGSMCNEAGIHLPSVRQFIIAARGDHCD